MHALIDICMGNKRDNRMNVVNDDPFKNKIKR